MIIGINWSFVSSLQRIYIYRYISNIYNILSIYNIYSTNSFCFCLFFLFFFLIILFFSIYFSFETRKKITISHNLFKCRVQVVYMQVYIGIYHIEKYKGIMYIEKLCCGTNRKAYIMCGRRDTYTQFSGKRFLIEKHLGSGKFHFLLYISQRFCLAFLYLFIIIFFFAIFL